MLSRLSIDERREQLIDCALELAQRSGMSAVTVRAVAEEAGLSLGIVHYCFANKDELTAAMMRRATTTQLDAFLSADVLAADTGSQSGREALRTLLTDALMAVLDLMRETPERWLVLNESIVMSLRAPATSGTHSLATDQQALAERYGAEFLQAVGERTSMSWGGSEREVVRFALQLVYGCVQWWLVDRDDAAAQRSFDNAIAWVVDGAVEV